MKIVVAKSGEPTIEEVPEPTCGPKEVLVRTAFSVISTGTETWTIGATDPIGPGEVLSSGEKLRKAVKLTTDVYRAEGLSGLMDYVRQVRNPTEPLGYSLSGEVVEVGRDIRDVVVGDFVACAGERVAAHAEYVAVPRNLVAKVPLGVPVKDAAFSTLGAIAVHGFRRSGAALGESICVLGAGLVGNLLVQVGKAAGCRVFAVDLREDRLAVARESGADDCFLASDPRLQERLSHATNGAGLDHVIVTAATEKSDPVNLAGAIVRDRGKVTVVGRVGMDLQRKDYYQKELEMGMSRSSGPGRYDPAYEEKGLDYPLSYVRWTLNRNMSAFMNLVLEGKVHLNGLVSGEYPIEEAVRAYSSMSAGQGAAVLLTYRSSPDEKMPSGPLVLTGPKVTSGIRTALIGPGNFAKEILLPLLRSQREYKLDWLVSSDPVRARQIAERYRISRCGTNYADVLQDPAVDLVVVTTPNDLHFDMTVQASRAGKAVFVEKPLCLTEHELLTLVKVQAETGARIIVGFNRRYAPLILKMKSLMAKLNGPFLINYRVNADYIPASGWVQDPEVGGGRIVAECCHFFDLFNFLVDSSDPRISVTCAGINGSTVVARDNLVAVARYSDGTVATLTYSALGNRTLDRERIEFFGDKTAMVLENFKRLAVYDKDASRVFGTGRIEKGHAQEFAELASLLAGRPSKIIRFDQSVAAMRTTFEAERQARAYLGSLP